MECKQARLAWTAYLSIPACLMVTALLSMPGECQQTDNSIEGQVRVTTGGDLPSGIVVKLEVAENVVVAKQMVGTTGKFEFHDLTQKLYQVIVTADGYQPGSAQVDMQYYASRFPTIYLTPVASKNAPPLPPGNITDLAAPKKARKEFDQGHAALEAKDFAGAREHFEKAIDTDPCYARALTELGVVLTIQENLAAAESSFQKSIHCDGEFLEAYLQMGILFDIEKKYAEGEAILQQSLRVAPSDWQPYYRLGALHQHAGRYKEAEQSYLKAESLSADVPAEVHVRLADAYLQQREYDQADAEIDTYLRVAPAGPLEEQAKFLRQQIDSERRSNSGPATGP